MTAPIAATRSAAPATVGRRTVTVTEWLTLLVAAALLVVASPSVGAPFWTPRVAIVLLVLGPALVALAVAAVSGDRASLAAVAFLGVAGLATWFAPTPLLALVGLYNDGTGWLFAAAVVGLWAAGRRLGPDARHVLGTFIIGAAVVNAAMVWLQSSTSTTGPLMDLVAGRGPGLLGNPVHVSALLAGAVALAVERLPRDREASTRGLAGGWVLIAFLVSGVQLAGGRTGVGLLVVLVLSTWIRFDVRRAVGILVAVACGLAMTAAAPAVGNDATSRLVSADGGWAGRVDRWKLAAPTVADRPVLGTGPGLYRRATSPHNTVAAARAFGPDSLNVSAHNLFVEYAVTTGIIGLAVLAAWMALAARGAHGELAWFALFGGASLLLQPQQVGLTAVLALALGAAAPRCAPKVPTATLALGLAVSAIGLLVAIGLVRGDVALAHALSDQDTVQAGIAADELSPWPEPEVARARAASYQAVTRRSERSWARAIEAARGAHRRDPSDPRPAVVLGNLEAAHGSRTRAARAFEDALRWNPQSAAALQGLAAVRRAEGDPRAASQLCRRYHEVAERGRCPV